MVFNRKEKLHFEQKQYRELCRQFFKNPQPPIELWEGEFDYADDKLWALSQKNWQKTTRLELACYYVLNLRYHDPLQVSLFRYLFPTALAIWAEEIDQNRSFEGFLGALHIGKVLPRMLDQQQMIQFSEFTQKVLISKINTPPRLANQQQYREYLTQASIHFEESFYTLSLMIDTTKVIENFWQLDTPMKVFGIIDLLQKAVGIHHWGWEEDFSYCLHLDGIYEEFPLMPINQQCLREKLLNETLIQSVEACRNIAELFMNHIEFDAFIIILKEHQALLYQRLQSFLSLEKNS